MFSDTWRAGSTTMAVLLFLSVNTGFVVWTTSGLENPLYAFFCALYCLQILRYEKAPANHSNAVAFYSGAACAGLSLTRPDGLVFLAAFPAVLAYRLLINKSFYRAEAKRLAVFLSASLLPVAGYGIFRAGYFGDLFPNTYYAKGGPSLKDLVELAALRPQYIKETYDLFEGVFSWLAGPAMVFVLLGCVYLLSKRNKAIPACFSIVLLCAWAQYCLLPKDWMGEYRFGTAFFLVLGIVIVSVLTHVIDSAFTAKRTRKILFLTCIVFLLGTTATVCWPRSFRFAERPTVPFKYVAEAFGLRFNYYADKLGISRASFLCPDLGGTLYFSRHRVYDLAGLCDRNMAQLIASKDSMKLRNYIFELKPTFIHIHNDWSYLTGFYKDDKFKALYDSIIENPSKWAEEIMGEQGVYSGDYVLREAIQSQEKLETLKKKTRNNMNPMYLPDRKKAQPFPRG